MSGDLIETIEHMTGMPLPLVFALAAGFLALVGVTVAMMARERAQKLTWVAELAAAILLGWVVVLHLAPELIEGGLSSFGWALVGAAGALALAVIAHQRPGSNGIMVFLAPVIAIGIHSFLDGWVHVLSNVHHHADHADHAHHATSGSTVSAGLIAHEFAEGVLVGLLCLNALTSRAVAFGVSFMTAAASTPLGALAALSLTEAEMSSILEWAEPMTAGFITLVAINLVLSLLGRFLRRHQPLPKSTSEG